MTTRFSNINDVVSHLTETLGLDECASHDDVEESVRHHQDVRYEDLHGAALDRLMCAVWDDVTEGAEYPWTDLDSGTPGLVEVLTVEPTGYEDLPPGTIDADVMVEGTPIGVTLCPAEDGRDMWVSYGTALDYWCSNPDVLCGRDGRGDRELISDVLSAVDAAARRAGLSPRD